MSCFEVPGNRSLVRKAIHGGYIKAICTFSPCIYDMQGVESQLFASLSEALSSSIPRDLVNYRTLEATVNAMKSLDEEAKNIYPRASLYCTG